METTSNEITVTVNATSGALECTAEVAGHLLRRTYMGYTRREAVDLHRVAADAARAAATLPAISAGPSYDAERVVARYEWATETMAAQANDTDRALYAETLALSAADDLGRWVAYQSAEDESAIATRLARRLGDCRLDYALEGVLADALPWARRAVEAQSASATDWARAVVALLAATGEPLPEWLARPTAAIRLAAAAAALAAAPRGYDCDACGSTGLAADEFVGAGCVDCVAPIAMADAEGEAVRA
jgi:hypothetical protein